MEDCHAVAVHEVEIGVPCESVVVFLYCCRLHGKGWVRDVPWGELGGEHYQIAIVVSNWGTVTVQVLLFWHQWRRRGVKLGGGAIGIAYHVWDGGGNSSAIRMRKCVLALFLFGRLWW